MKRRISGYMMVNFVLVTLIVVLGILLLDHRTLSVINEGVGGPIYSVPQAKGKVSLMINVDWGEEHLPKMLATLEEKGVKATFFLTGTWAKKQPELARQIAEAGHEIASHGATTAVMMDELNADQTRKNLEQAQTLIQEASGITPALFAPHAGNYSSTTQEVAAKMGLPMILWSIDTIDWKRDGQEKILSRVFKAPHDGALLLMHPTQDTAAVLARIIDGFRERGFEPDTVSALLAYRD